MNIRSKDTRLTDKQQQSPLSERQQLLISRFSDGECSCVSNFLAKRLLAKNHSARELLSELEELRSSCGELFISRDEIKVDLWRKIETRIEQEERAALYLGQRRLKESKPSLFERIDLRQALLGGASGAAIAAALLITLTTRPSEIVKFRAPHADLVSGSGIIHQAGVGAANSNTQHPNYLTQNRASRNPLQVDWMRANGSLRLIPDPNGSSSIIWIRRQPSQYGPNRLLSPTPLGGFRDAATSKQNRLDGTTRSGAK